MFSVDISKLFINFELEITPVLFFKAEWPIATVLEPYIVIIVTFNATYLLLSITPDDIANISALLVELLINFISA